MNTDIPTPRTDAAQIDINSCTGYPEYIVVEVDVSRKLERKLAVALARVAELEPNNQRLQEAVDKLLLNSLL